MSQLALGIIETVGLAACMEAADTCVKSANINIVGYELSKGSGMAVLKIQGDVGAVKAAIEAAKISASKVNTIFASKVIARPSEQIDVLVENKDTVGYKEAVKEENVVEDIEAVVSTGDTEEFIEEIQIQEVQEKFTPEDNLEKEDDIEKDNDVELTEVENDEIQDEVQEDDIEVNDTESEVAEYTCNICKDPKCSRQKWDLRSNCIHYEDTNNK